MKLIIAYIQPESLNDVKDALAEKQIAKMSVVNALGCGTQGGFTELYRGASKEVNLLKKVRLEIGVNDDYVQQTVNTIIAVARSGHIGDGKIFILPLEQCIRIRTGETDNAAIG